MTFVRMRNKRQITLPKDACGALDLKEHDYLEVTLDEDRIVLKPSARYARPAGWREEIMVTPIQ
jgi:AbrB family looped-hinge helix DNA binding protein